TGARSPGEELMTCSTSAVAVCCSKASRVSVIRRAFSIAMTACAAKFRSSAISLSVNGRTSSRDVAMAPSSPSFVRAATEREPATARRPSDVDPGEVAGRRIDDLQYPGGRGLLLQRLARLGQQPRVLHRDYRLRGEVFEQRDLFLGKRPHLAASRGDHSEER